MALINFDAGSVAPQQSFEPVPEGWYNVTITASENKLTKAATPDNPYSYLALTMEVLDGPHKGRKLFTNLNLVNANPTAVEIAQQSLSAICHATGQLKLADSQELHGKPFAAKVVVRPPRTVGDRTFDASNEVKGYKAVAGAPAPAVPPAAETAATNTATTSGVPASPPWQQ